MQNADSEAETQFSWVAHKLGTKVPAPATRKLTKQRVVSNGRYPFVSQLYSDQIYLILVTF